MTSGTLSWGDGTVPQYFIYTGPEVDLLGEAAHMMTDLDSFQIPYRAFNNLTAFPWPSSIGAGGTIIIPELENGYAAHSF
jgi:hypothetical protein